MKTNDPNFILKTRPLQNSKTKLKTYKTFKEETKDPNWQVSPFISEVLVGQCESHCYVWLVGPGSAHFTVKGQLHSLTLARQNPLHPIFGALLLLCVQALTLETN